MKSTLMQVGGDHYKDMNISPAEFIHKNQIGFLAGCVIKRLCRFKKKGGVEDLKKAIHEICMIAEMEYGIDLADYAACGSEAAPKSASPPQLTEQYDGVTSALNKRPGETIGQFIERIYEKQ